LKHALCLFTVVVSTSLVFACSSTDSGSSSGASSGGGGTSSSGGSSGATSSSGGGGSCSGNVTDCAPATLSGDQITTMCDTLAAVSGDPAGTKYECKSGTHANLFITVNDRAACIRTWPKAASCTITGRQLIDCYKAAKADACAAFDGACKFVIDDATIKACASQ
jgi:hypothetical protein